MAARLDAVPLNASGGPAESARDALTVKIEAMERRLREAERLTALPARSVS